MNIWTGTVRVVADCETRYSANGGAIATVKLVADSGFGDKKKPLWMRGAIFGKRAEGGLPGMLLKGQQLAVSGELSMNEWENNDGHKMSSLEIILEKIDLVGGRKEQAPESGGSGRKQQVDDEIPF